MKVAKMWNLSNPRSRNIEQHSSSIGNPRLDFWKEWCSTSKQDQSRVTTQSSWGLTSSRMKSSLNTASPKTFGTMISLSNSNCLLRIPPNKPVSLQQFNFSCICIHLVMPRTTKYFHPKLHRVSWFDFVVFFILTLLHFFFSAEILSMLYL